MTELATPLPTLYLPTVHLVEARARIEDAITRLQSAQEVQWVSAVGDAYRLEIYATIQDLRALLGRVEACQDQWTRVRWAAYAAGQL